PPRRGRLRGGWGRGLGGGSRRQGASAVTEVLEDELAERATALWLEAVPAGSRPESVETLKPAHRKSAVLRLAGAGSDGCSVVAKRAARPSIEGEARVYRDVL